MKLSLSAGFLAVSLAYAQGSIDQWAAGGAEDFRGPCPMMNTLANHGFLPHNGRNITRANAIHALSTGLNFDESLASLMWEQAVIANPEPNATFFTLDHLNRHNVLEHDASLSRSDAYFGNNHVFNQTVFDASRAWWTDATLTPAMLANSKLFRQIESRAANPDYTFSSRVEAFSLGEVAAPLIVFGDHATETVSREWVEYFFENERLPTELGWTKQAETVALDLIMHFSEVVENATSLITGDATTSPHAKRGGDLHAGFGAAVRQWKA
ncbi:chloroperoxidase protein [Diplodia corticola]|uniref:Chloroperoxidase protein n=1 Tax=Diplodia corticola TaxID=236234 RepID=A0A1J9RB42_9PEZI|nr:chloroperoxidase protein [Diplodia corticola]OJD29643.1 chloroperoxidase protein [Diplodia corticola]